MEPTQPAPGHARRKSLKVGIVDLIERQPAHSVYSRMLNANYASIMPQVVAVWAEQMGHEVDYVTYTGFEDLRRELPQDVDIVFISAYTQAAYLAYSISNFYRKQSVVRVLGGPHARAYAEDAREHFDYVVSITDQKLICDLLRDFSPNPNGGVVLSGKQPAMLPGVRERWKFIRKAQEKTWIMHIVQMLGSVGCPYRCKFCIDADSEYRPLPYEQIREDLAFLQKQLSPPTVGWDDPNFGVRFDDFMNVIESAGKPGKLQFVAESSLSLLSEPHLKRLKANHFIAMFPGVESWFDFNDKARQRKNVGMDKVKSVAEHVNMVMRYVPYVQTNFIFGWDSDSGSEPFELTKRFLELAPGVYPKYSLLTLFGNSAALNHQYQVEGRVIDVPFFCLDGYSALNLRLKNYSCREFFEHVIDLMRYTVSPSMVWKRFRANKHPQGKWMNLIRALSSERTGGTGTGMIRHYVEIRDRLATDREFHDFYSGDSIRPPRFYLNQIRTALGPFFDELPTKVMSYLQRGEPGPNQRISNANPIRINEAAGVLRIQ